MSGRIRSLKPEWKEDELLAAASDEARVLSAALILMADDYGNGRASIATIAAETWRYQLEANDGAQAPEALAKASRAFRELLAIRYVGLYVVDGQKYFAIRNWGKHQRVDKPGKPKVPPPPAGLFSKEQKTRESVASDSRECRESLVPEGNRRERREEEDPEKSKVLNAAAGSERPISREKPEVSASAAEDLQKKSECLLRDPAAATFDSPANWPEVQDVARDFADSMGLRPPKLGLIPADRGVLAIVTLFAAGFSPLELAQAAHAAKTDPWFRDPKAKRGLSSLSVEVVRRLLEPASGTHRTQTPEELAKIAANNEAKQRYLAAEREKLVADSYQEFKAAAETGLAYLGIRRPA